MRKSAVTAAFLALFAVATAQRIQPRRKIPCKTPASAQSCYWTHGRLTFCCGTPAVRLWKIGTHRVLGIFSGPEAYSSTRGEILEGDNEHPELPKSVEDLTSQFRANSMDNTLPAVFGDFEVCPLDPEKPKTMQAACIQTAKNLIAK